jgi:GrpB-like predicted nucleotidyltransferase (UPF0157 family)
MTIKDVRVVPYDPSWPHDFVRERESLEVVLDGAAKAFHHVGSTSVPGLASKPVIDILGEARDLALIDAGVDRLEALGYEARGEYGIDGRRYFSRAAGEGPKVHLHFFAEGHPRTARHLLFRDYLREHPVVASEYGELKRRLASRHPRDRDAYQEAKAAFIETVHGDAARWHAEGARRATSGDPSKSG